MPHEPKKIIQDPHAYVGSVTLISVVMPAYNEVSTIEAAVKSVISASRPGTQIELIVVESGSNDGTKEVLSQFADNPQLKIISESSAMGKGHAVRTGFEAATGQVITIFDADNEYAFEDIWKLLPAIETGITSFVLGTRHHQGAEIRQFEDNMRLARAMNIMHWILATTINLSFGVRLKDPFTMWKVFRRELLDDINLTCNRFDLDWEIVGTFCMNGCKPLEIPISYESRGYEQGKKVRLVRDPITWLAILYKMRFSRSQYWRK